MHAHTSSAPCRRLTRTAALGLLVLCSTGSSITRAELRLANIFNDYMVLQQGQPVRVWGWTAADGEVTVTFADQERTATADRGGLWLVELSPLTATFDERVLTVTSAEESGRIEHVLVGEVWLCGGQSNMAWSVTADTEWDMESESYDYPAVRLCKIGQRSTTRPQRDLSRRPRWMPRVVARDGR